MNLQIQSNTEESKTSKLSKPKERKRIETYPQKLNLIRINISIDRESMQNPADQEVINVNWGDRNPNPRIEWN